MTRNLDNKLNFTNGTRLLILKLEDGRDYAIPTKKELSNARILEVNNDGSFTAHWSSNWNLNGDFSSELMSFDNNLVMDEGDLEARNEFRIKNGLMPIK